MRPDMDGPLPKTEGADTCTGTFVPGAASGALRARGARALDASELYEADRWNDP
jgi:hypothetical protein